MKPRGLIVDDDPLIRKGVGEILLSLGHEFDGAESQEEARQHLARSQYSYILLDLQIPVVAGSDFTRVENGENLLAEILANPVLQHVPVIVMTGHGRDAPHLAVKLMKQGAVDFVTKPLEGDALDSAILGALARRHRSGPAPTPATPALPARPFQGGELVIHEQHAELCGVTILENTSRGHAWEVFQALSQKDENGKPRRYSGRRLAALLGRSVGENAVVQCIGSLRRKIAEALKRELNVTVAESDVILSRDQGYRLNPWIVVRQAGQPGSSPVGAGYDPGVTPHVPGDNGDDPGDTTLNERQRWALNELRRGALIRRNAVEERFKCSPKTAKRDLADLRSRGLIEFVDEPHPGHYRLIQHAQVA